MDDSKTIRTLLALAALLAIWPALPAVAAGPAPAATAGSAAFDRLKKLEGEWQGTTGRGAPIAIRYHVGAGGSMITETQAPGTADEMVTVYNLDGDDLVLTHYCPMGGPRGNQPHMRLDRASKPGELDFVFTGASNLDAAKDMHVHNGRIVFLGDDRIRREWSVYQNGRQVETDVFTMTRRK